MFNSSANSGMASLCPSCILSPTLWNLWLHVSAFGRSVLFSLNGWMATSESIQFYGNGHSYACLPYSFSFLVAIRRWNSFDPLVNLPLPAGRTMTPRQIRKKCRNAIKYPHPTSCMDEMEEWKKTGWHGKKWWLNFYSVWQCQYGTQE